MHTYKDYDFSIVIQAIGSALGRKKKYAAKLQSLLHRTKKEWVVRDSDRILVGETWGATRQLAEAKLVAKVERWIDEQS